MMLLKQKLFYLWMTTPTCDTMKSCLVLGWPSVILLKILVYDYYIKCFDAADWASGKASSMYNMPLQQYAVVLLQSFGYLWLTWVNLENGCSNGCLYVIECIHMDNTGADSYLACDFL